MYGNRITTFGLGVLVAASTLFSRPSDVAAYDVCTDDYANRGVATCAHEKMFDEALRFYSELVVPNRFSQEIIDYASHIQRTYDVAADGQRFLVARADADVEATHDSPSSRTGPRC